MNARRPPATTSPSPVPRGRWLVPLVLLLAGSARAADVVLWHGPPDPVRASEIQDHVDFLASDRLEGRNAGTEGERLAAAYLVAALERIPPLVPGGEDGTWFQEVPLPSRHELDPGRNVIALLPGTDPDLARETIVLGAHYDHVGRGHFGNGLGPPGAIFNGADDNASGSAVVLELAVALATSPDRPRRTIAFHWYTGEELGLLGSKAYVEDPLRPLEDTVAMINLDMVGRLTGRTLMMGGTGTSPVFPRLVRALGRAHGLVIREDPTGVAPSDNSNFHEKGVPVLFAFTGIHEDYHRPGDDPDELEAEGAAIIGRYLEDVVRAIDGFDERPVFTSAPGFPRLFTPRPFYGITFDAAEPGMVGGAVIAVVVEGSPAHVAGLREGDVVFKLDGTGVTDHKVLRDELLAVGLDLHPRRFTVWRGLPGVEHTPADEWLDAHELLEIEVTPIIR